MTTPAPHNDDVAAFPPGLGFRSGDRGTHTSRSISLRDLESLLAAVPAGAPREAYREAVVDHNVLSKRTVSNRRLIFQRLSEFYALDEAVLVFRTMRRLWEADASSLPLLACLLANARDPLLRLTSSAVLKAANGDRVPKSALADAVLAGAPGRFNAGILDKVARNAGASWTYSGHLTGHVTKTRSRAAASPASAAYALLLGYLTGRRGAYLLDTFWTKLLDTSSSELADLAFAA